MPWTEILGGATGMLAVLIVAALFLDKLIIERMADTITKLVEDKLRRNEELHKSFLAFTSAVDTDLRTKRIPVYAELWKKTGVLPKWPRNTALEYQDLQQFTGELRKWYFEDGGIYLSESARNAYFAVQESIQTTLEGHKAGRVSDEEYEAIRAQCSALRTELTEDLLSRKAAPSP